MNPSTKQFIWKDRDAVAHDLLQLTYHAPPSIARRTLQLLQALRSLSVVPELISIVEDEAREMWQRIYALRSIAATPGDQSLPQLQSEMNHILQRRATIMKNHPRPEYAYLGNDLLDDIRDLAAYHPSNRSWFFATLDDAPGPAVVLRFLETAICHMQPEEFRQSLIEYLLKLLDKHPNLITPSAIQTLMFEESTIAQLWLHQHVDDIVEILASDINDPDVLSIAEQWEEVHKRLSQIDDHFEYAFNAFVAELQTRRQAHILQKESSPDYRLSPAYQHLYTLYQQAADGDQQAYSKLIRIAKKPRGNIPLRAVATHMLGMLRHGYDVTDILGYLLKYAQDDWDNDIVPLSPVRVEAGKSLKDIASPEAWEVIIDAFFINPMNVLSDFMLDWIAHITDVLEGIPTAYAGVLWGPRNERRWFRALAEISDEQLQQELS